MILIEFRHVVHKPTIYSTVESSGDKTIKNLMSGPPISHRIVVATLATLAGAYVVKDAGKDFEFVKFTPHSEEEVERRKKENIGLTFRQLDTRTLEYTPEAKKRLSELAEIKRKEEDIESQKKKGSSDDDE